MCGICGSAGQAPVRLMAMAEALRHRGPDDEGVFTEEALATLAARRLSIIDVPGGHQPIQNEDGSVTVVFNGEIYNYGTLRQRLAEGGHTLATESDTEVLVHLYEDYGAELVHALEGMFAFAIWDANRRLLILARDRFGEKPLFYTERSGSLTFASEVDALVAGGAASWEIDPQALNEYFTFGYIAAPRSVVSQVQQLPAACLLTWSAESGSTIRRYWDPPQHAPALNGSVDELVEETETLLEASVRSRLVADVPVGLFLSGGVDSTLLAALAARSARRLETYTVTYSSGSVSEGEAARRSAQLVGAEHEELLLTSDQVRRCVPAYLARLDQPLADEAFVALRAVSEFARRSVKVAVGGEGADEVFGGYPRYRWLARSAELNRWVPKLGRERAAELAAGLPGRARRLEHLLADRPLVDRHVDWVTAGRRALRQEAYGPRLLEAFHQQFSAVRTLSENGSVEGLLMRLDQRDWLPNDVLAKADRASMHASLELRTPYLHRELVEFAASVPPSVHAADGGKNLLRRVLARVLPQAASRRAKVAFRTPTAEWLRGPLAPALREQVEGGRLYSGGWFNRDAVARWAGEHQSGSDRSAVLWPIFVLGVWLEAR